MFQVVSREGEVICECACQKTALGRLDLMPNAHFVQEVKQIWKLVKVKEDASAPGEPEKIAAPY